MELDQLRAIVQLARHGTVAGAARSLGIARSTVTRRIEALERTIGVSLVEMDATGAVLTERGQLLAEEAAAALDALDALGARVQQHDSEPRGILRAVLQLGVHPIVASQVGLTVRGRYPDIALVIRQAERPLDVLRDWGDMAVVLGHTLVEGPWTARVVARLPFRLQATRTYLEQHGTPTLETLDQHALVCWCQGVEDEEVLLPLRGGGTVAVRPDIRTSDLHLATTCVRQGGGLGVVPANPLPAELIEYDEVVTVLEDEVGDEVPAWVVIRTGVARTPRVRAVLDDMQALAEALDVAP